MNEDFAVITVHLDHVYSYISCSVLSIETNPEETLVNSRD